MAERIAARSKESTGRQVRTIAVVRMLRGLGDMLCVVPALRALRSALPGARVTLIGLPPSKEFVTRFRHYIDELVESPGYPGIPEARTQIGRLPRFFAAMQERSFDLALQLHGDGTVANPFTVMLGARANAGFFLPDRFCPDRDRFLPYRKDEPEAARYVRLLAHLGIPPLGEDLEFPLWRSDREALSALPDARKLMPGGYVCVHPGASSRDRRWPPERFARLADAVYDFGFPIVLTGDAAEKRLVRRVGAAMKSQPVDLAGRTSLGALAALLSGARLLICNDTGVSHLAAALCVPSVVIFTGSDPARWAPLDHSLHRAIDARAEGDTGRAPSGRRSKPQAGIDEALAAAEELLWRHGAGLDTGPLRSRAPLRCAMT
jgi:ADP-heptose:LPS heptosyltransferase